MFVLILKGRPKKEGIFFYDNQEGNSRERLKINIINSKHRVKNQLLLNLTQEDREF